MPQPFVHLHLHTQYSLLDGAIKHNPLFERVKALNMPAVAMTDHGNLFGAVEFYEKAREIAVEEGANHVTNLLDLEPGDFEEKLGLKKLERVRFLQAIEDLRQMREREQQERRLGGGTGMHTTSRL